MNFDEFLEALSATDDRYEKRKIYKAFTSQDRLEERMNDYLKTREDETSMPLF